MTWLPQPPGPGRTAHRDQMFERWAAELVEHDERVRGLDVVVHFDGGVAHVTGSVHSPGQLDELRRLLGRLDGVLAVWDRVQVAGRRPVVLDLGCGDTKQYDDNIGVDLRTTAATALLADVSRPLPFGPGSVDAVFAVHVLEHLIDFLPLVDECHRVLRPGGVLHVLSPWWRHVNAVADPTHVRFLDVQTIKGICARAGSNRYWHPLHAGCDGATVFADLTPVVTAPDPAQLARFFD